MATEEGFVDNKIRGPRCEICGAPSKCRISGSKRTSEKPGAKRLIAPWLCHRHAVQWYFEADVCFYCQADTGNCDCFMAFTRRDIKEVS